MKSEKKERRGFKEIRGGVDSRENAAVTIHLVGDKTLAALWEAGTAMDVNVNEIVGPDTDYHFKGGTRRTKPGQHLISITATSAQLEELRLQAKIIKAQKAQNLQEQSA